MKRRGFLGLSSLVAAAAAAPAVAVPLRDVVLSDPPAPRAALAEPPLTRAAVVDIVMQLAAPRPSTGYGMTFNGRRYFIPLYEID